ncbi:tape measure protein [Limosilactobacillus fermentum]
MAESMSVEAILSAVDQNFTRTMENAVNQLSQVTRQSQASGAGLVRSGALMGAGMAIASKAIGVVKDSMSGAISRFDTLNKYPVVMQALGYSTNDVAKSAQTLKKGIDGLPTSLDEITSISQQLGPLTGGANKAAKSAIALNNAFLASGASTADTSRGLQQYTQMLSTGKVDLMSYRTLMETMPIALRKVANSFGFTGKSAENDLYTALQKGQITTDQLNDRFIKLNGGVNGFASLAKKNSAGIATSFANLKNAVVKNLANMMDSINAGFANAGLGSIAQQLDNLKGVINGTFTAIGPVVTTATTAIITAFRGVFSFVSANKSWLTPLTVGIASFIASFTAISKITSVVSGVTKTISGLTSTFNTVKESMGVMQGLGAAIGQLSTKSTIAGRAAQGLVALFSANPLTIAIAGIVAVGAALAIFFTQTQVGRQAWQSFTTFIGQAIQQVMPIIQPILNGIVQLVQTAGNSLMQAFMALQPVFATLMPVLQQLWQAIMQMFQTLAPVIMPALQGIAVILGGTIVAAVIALIGALTILTITITTIVSLVSMAIATVVAIVQSLVAIISAVMQTISAVIRAIMQTIVAIFTGHWSQIPQIWSNGGNRIKSIWSTLGKTIASIARGWGNSLISAGRSMINGFLSGLRAGFDAVKNFVSGIASWIKKHKGPISYDRKLLIPAGQAIMSGLNEGLTAEFSNVQSNVSTMADRIQSAVNGANTQYASSFGNLQGTITNTVNGQVGVNMGPQQTETNRLLQQIAQKDTTMVLDDGTLVGATYSAYDRRLGQNVALSGRWS